MYSFKAIVDLFKSYEHQLFWTAIVIACWIISKIFVKRAIKRLSINLGVSIERRIMTVKIINIIFLLFATIFIITIWGVDKKELFLFFTSIITVLGIGFFAQWSILSNITSGIIIFFSHPIKLGDQIKIIDKDFFIEGKLINISFFYLYLEDENGGKITVPNSIALQKSIVILK